MIEKDKIFPVIWPIKRVIETIERSLPDFEGLGEAINLPKEKTWELVCANLIIEEKEEISSTWGKGASWQKFESCKEEIFRHEVFVPTSYHNIGGDYLFVPPSRSYDNLFWIVYCELGGKDDYKDPGELLVNFQKVLKGQKVLEIGCGPGFALKVLADVGAEVRGIDIRSFDFLPEAKVVQGNACNLEDYFGDEKFDLIITYDFFCEDVVISQEDSLKVLQGSSNILKEKGLMINQVSFFRADSLLNRVCQYFQFKQDGLVKDIDGFIDYLQRGDLTRPLWSNEVSLRIDHCFMAGFQIKRIWTEAGCLNIVLER